MKLSFWMMSVAMLSVATLPLAQGSTAFAQKKTAKAPKAPKPITAKEKKQGDEAHPQLVEEFGGAYPGKEAAYVESVGRTIAVQSGLSSTGSDFTVTLLNSPINNAFAIPGGYIYSTRQLLALMNNEAELAGVLGHEVGHVAARHSRGRQKTGTLATIGGIIGTVAGAAIGDNGGLAGILGGLLQENSMKVAQLYTLGFSRSQETESDDLGIRYLTSAGYDPKALSTMLSSLAAQDALDSRVAGQPARSIPAWASTHPDPAKRVSRAASQAVKTGVTNGKLNTDQFLNAINGMLYADDPKQGVIEGRKFLHPDLKLGFEIPQGFGMQNGTRAVSISSSAAQGEFTTAQYNGDMDAYIKAVFSKLVKEGTALPAYNVQRATVNGLPTAYASLTTTGGQQQVTVTVYAYEFASNSAFHFMTVTPAGQGAALEPMYQSVRRLSAAEVAAIKPRKLVVVTAKSSDTIASLSSRMAYDSFQTERFLTLNRLDANAVIKSGQRLKIVTY
jgi:predicted Zn-dependent protease